MESINSVGKNLATDGQYALKSKTSSSKKVSQPLVADVHEVVQTLTKNIAQGQKDAEEIKRVSDIVLGQKTKFSVNSDLGQIVVAIVDPQTNQVIKEIPSVDQQKIMMKIKKTTGLLFDQSV